MTYFNFVNSSSIHFFLMENTPLLLILKIQRTTTIQQNEGMNTMQSISSIIFQSGDVKSCISYIYTDGQLKFNVLINEVKTS